MTTATQPNYRISKLEVGVLAVIVAAGLVLLLPALPASREAARANLCRGNLRQLDLFTRDYIEHQRALLPHLRNVPQHFTWASEFTLHMLSKPGRRSQDRVIDVFTMPRPVKLTCPSQPDLLPTPGVPQAAHYTLVIDWAENRRWDQTRWKYRDTPLVVGQQTRKAWYMDNEISWSEAEEQLRRSRGPHANGAFLESDSQGSNVVRELVP
jgi:hypothetical protein